jgi:acetyl/propionyl-CoA carboxylase alpha subunit
MRRALAEYDVHGIKTTIPFFQWILDDPDFVAARFDTTFIDRKLAARNGDPWRAAGADVEELAAMAAALNAAMRPQDGPADRGAAAPVSRWKSSGRFEARC